MTADSRDTCPPVDDASDTKQPLSHAGADARARPRVGSEPIARIELKRIALKQDAVDTVFYRHRIDPNKVREEAICCRVLKNRDDVPPDEERVAQEPELTERESKRRTMSPFPPGTRVRFIPRIVGQYHTLDKVTLWKRPGPHARQINLWWREHKTEDWYKQQRRAELHSVQLTGTQATVISFLVCAETGQRWVALLLDGGRGMGWCYAIDALELV